MFDMEMLLRKLKMAAVSVNC